MPPYDLMHSANAFKKYRAVNVGAVKATNPQWSKSYNVVHQNCRPNVQMCGPKTGSLQVRKPVLLTFLGRVSISHNSYVTRR